jgi:inosine-uridine nucleoside N-ribohydrolase
VFRRLSFLLTSVVALALPLGAAVRPAAPAGPTPVPVVLTTDCGVEIDDQWAIAHIALSRQLALGTIVTTHASSVGFSSAASARTARDTLARIVPEKAASVRVIAGADGPLPDAATARGGLGVTALLDASSGFSRSRRLMVLSIGAATDVASAILKDPSIVDRIAIVAMGFDDWPAGGDEFNVRNDPQAWRVILKSGVPLVVGSGAAARKSLRLTTAGAAGVMRAHGAIGEYLYGLVEGWLAGHADLAARMVAPGAWVIWDEVVVAYALGLARGDDVARPALEPDLFFSHPRTAGRITWITEVDTNRLWDDFAKKIDAYEAAHAPRGR